MLNIRIFLFILHIFFIPRFLLAQKEIQLSGKAIQIQDGDSFTLLTSDYQQYKIRLKNIDCPEKRQPFGQEAKQKLAVLIFRKPVTIRYHKKDRNGRLLANVFCEQQLVNKTMTENGFAWHFRKYTDSLQWQQLEDKARLSQLGLWSDPVPIPPWVWRKI